MILLALTSFSIGLICGCLLFRILYKFLREMDKHSWNIPFGSKCSSVGKTTKAEKDKEVKEREKEKNEAPSKPWGDF